MPRSKNKFIFIQKFRAKMKSLYDYFVTEQLQNLQSTYIFAFCIKCSCFREIMNIHGMNFEFIESGMFYMNWSFYENMTLQLHYKYVNYSTIKTPKSWRNCHNGMTIVEWRTVVDCCIYWDESHRTYALFPSSYYHLDLRKLCS